MNYKQTDEHLCKPIDPCESIYQISKDQSLDETYLQTPTPSENKFLRMLIANFKSGDHNCALTNLTIFQGRRLFADYKDVNELLRKNEGLKNAGADLTQERNTRGIVARVPDLIILELGLIVEIDGDSHYRYDNKVKRDPNREAIFRSLGFQTLIVSNSELNCPIRVQKLIISILNEFPIKSKKSISTFEFKQISFRKRRYPNHKYTVLNATSQNLTFYKVLQIARKT